MDWKVESIWKKGDHVEVRRGVHGGQRGDHGWFRGVVTALNADGLVCVTVAPFGIGWYLADYIRAVSAIVLLGEL